MRAALLALAAIALAAGPSSARPRAAATAARDWTATVTRTVDGATLVGNPAATVRLTEYLSFVCPHCAAFVAASHPVLKEQWLRAGTLSLELRPAPTQPMDLAAAMLARCTGPRFSPFTDAVFAQQQGWFERGADWQARNAARISLYPPLARLRAVAEGAGLTDLARTAGGLAPADIDRCFASEADLRTITAIAGAARIEGTPSFAINGRPVGIATWASLEPQLRAAGAH